jgi:hypothetical protein
MTERVELDAVLGESAGDWKAPSCWSEREWLVMVESAADAAVELGEF